MSYAKAFSKQDPEKPVDLFTIYPSDEEDDDCVIDGLAVGDSVRMLRGRREGAIGVIVRAAYGSYVVEPYNDPYFNNPRNLTKLGPFCGKELVKVKRPKNASTVYVSPSFQKQEDEYTAEEEMPVVTESVSQRKGRGPGKKERKGIARRGKLTREKKSEEEMKVNAKQKIRMLEQIDKVIEFKGNDNVAVLKELPYISEKLFGKPLMLDWIRKVGPETVVTRGKYDLVKIKAKLVTLVPTTKEKK